ncbi:MAG: hypothetical protein HW403_1494, partial [Dehalococcoidia bacterium]|nr:hypothetical protein [Dehalococcoidia bacterium]
LVLAPLTGDLHREGESLAAEDAIQNCPSYLNLVGP